MSDALELYRTKKDLPIPDDKVDVKAGSEVIAYQGYIGKNVLETIEYTESGLDPKDKKYFSYYLTKDKKYFQLMAFLEEENGDKVAINNFSKTFATDYSERYPKTTGKKLGILTDINNNPIQEVSEVTASGYIDLNNIGTETFKVIISDKEIVSGTGTDLSSTNPKGSCKRIKQIKGGSSDGTYTIDPEANGTGFKVYCDMTTDGGGWTLVGKTNSGNVPIFGHLDGTAWGSSPIYNNNILFNNSEYGINAGWNILLSGVRLCRGGKEKCLAVDLKKSQVKEGCSGGGTTCNNYNYIQISMKDIFTNNISIWKFENDKIKMQKEAKNLGIDSFIPDNYINSNGCGINIGIAGSRRVRIGCGGDQNNNDHSYDDSSVGIGISSCPNGGCGGTTTPLYSTYVYKTEVINDKGPDPKINYIFIK